MNSQNQLQDLAKMVLITSAFGVSYCISRELNKRYFDKDWSKPLDRKTILPFLCEGIAGSGFAGLGLVTLTIALDALDSVSPLPEIDDKDTSGENNEEKKE